MKLDLFQNIKGVDENRQHDKFKFLKNSVQAFAMRNILNSWTEDFVDKDRKFVREFQETFHSSFWEIFLYRLFVEAGFELDQTHQMPDFIIKSPQGVYVEAVVANIKENGREEYARTLYDQYSMIKPPYLQQDFDAFLNEAITRASNAFHSKHNKFKNEYRKYEWVDTNHPYIIAIGSYDQVNYGIEYIYSMAALLYGLYFNKFNEEYEQKSKIVKPGTKSEIPIGLFNNEDYSDVSAVIFSCTVTIGKLTALSISNGNILINTVHNIRRDCNNGSYILQKVSKESPEDLADGVFVFHNPNARNKIHESLFSDVAVTQFFMEEGSLKYKGNGTPIVLRSNNSILGISEYELQEAVRMFNRLSVNEFYSN